MEDFMLFFVCSVLSVCVLHVSQHFETFKRQRDRKKQKHQKKHAIKVFEQRTKSSAKEWHVMNIDNT